MFMSVWGVVCLSESGRMALMVTAALLASHAIWLWMVTTSDCRADPEHTAGTLYPITLKVECWAGLFQLVRGVEFGTWV